MKQENKKDVVKYRGFKITLTQMKLWYASVECQDLATEEKCSVESCTTREEALSRIKHKINKYCFY